MKVNQIVVSMREIRTSPIKGDIGAQYECCVSYSAIPDEGEDPGAVTLELRMQAREHVLAECNEWERQVADEVRVRGKVYDKLMALCSSANCAECPLILKEGGEEGLIRYPKGDEL